MVNLYLAELLARERTAEVERKARRHAALYPIPDQWLESPIEESRHMQVPIDATSTSPNSKINRGRGHESSYRCAEAWRRRRACLARRHRSPSNRERVSGGRR